MSYIQFYRGKLHRFTVTEADLNYTGSITIDSALLEASGLKPLEKVQVLNVNSGARIETYIIAGTRNSGTICLNGAAARLFQPGDKVIIIGYILLTPLDELTHEAYTVIATDDTNLNYNVEVHNIAATKL